MRDEAIDLCGQVDFTRTDAMPLLERDTQLLIPVYDYCVPKSECPCDAQEDPCGLFRSVAFPMNEFFPPNAVETPCDYNSTKNYCACH